MPAQGFGEGETVDGVDEVEQPDGQLGLVTLKVADQVPAGARLELGQGRGLRLRLLNPVLAHVRRPRGDHLGHQLGRVRLGHRDERDLLRPPARRPRRLGDRLLHPGVVRC